MIVARGDLVKDNKAVLKRFLKAHGDAVRFVQTNQAETINAVADETKLTKDQVKRLLGKYDFDPSLRPAVIQELRECADFMLDADMIKKPVDIDNFVAAGLL